VALDHQHLEEQFKSVLAIVLEQLQADQSLSKLDQVKELAKAVLSCCLEA
jgi:hypothetical protein